MSAFGPKQTLDATAEMQPTDLLQWPFAQPGALPHDQYRHFTVRKHFVYLASEQQAFDRATAV